MISVIMPTIWIGQRYIEMLPIYESNPLIEEVIVIDNDTTNTDEEIFNYKKVVYLPQKENIYVNPAWNLGSSVAKCDALCFANDDIAVDLSFLEEGLQYITPEFGMLGMGSESIRHMNKISMSENKLERSGSKIESIDVIKPYYATFFFLHKKNYHNIPEEIKIFYGDTFLFEKNKKMGKQNHKLVDAYALTYLGSSSRSFKKICDDDYYIYRDIII